MKNFQCSSGRRIRRSVRNASGLGITIRMIGNSEQRQAAPERPAPTLKVTAKLAKTTGPSQPVKAATYRCKRHV